MAAVRDSQVSVEVLQTTANPDTFNTQITVESLVTSANPETINTQITVEALIEIPTVGGDPFPSTITIT